VADKYFDAVVDINTQPLFNGTTEETVAWLEANPSTEPRWVCLGVNMQFLTVSEYLDLAT
jgi:hypothetical protein